MQSTHGNARMAERLARFLQHVDYEQATTVAQREAVFRLRHACYLQEGAIDRRPDGRFSDDYDRMDNAWIYALTLEDRLVASIRFHVISREQRRGPALDVFPDIVSPLIEQGMVLVDPTRLVVDRAASRAHPELPYVTVRIACMASEHFGAEVCLATVRAEHAAFYQRIFGFRAICEPRPYPTLKKPIALMIGDMAAIRDEVAERWPLFMSTFTERRMLFDRPDITLPTGRTRGTRVPVRPALGALAGSLAGTMPGGTGFTDRIAASAG